MLLQIVVFVLQFCIGAGFVPYFFVFVLDVVVIDSSHVSESRLLIKLSKKKEIRYTLRKINLHNIQYHMDISLVLYLQVFGCTSGEASI